MDPLINIHPSILVHVTEPEKAKSIIESGGFECVKNGIYGPGGYFAERETQGKIVAHHQGAVVICHVNLGRICKVHRSELPMAPEELKNQNYDSIRGSFNTGPLYCVFDPSRITPLFAMITEINISGVEETYYLIKTDNGIIRLGKIPLNNLIIKVKENKISISDSDKPPFASLSHNEPALGEREIIFVHRGDFHFENVDIFLHLHPTVLIHFTDPESAKSIITTGQMKPIENGLFGPGDYFAESDSQIKLENLESGALVVCLVTLGQMFKAESKTLPMSVDELKSHHYDSIQVKLSEGYEYCVFDMSRVVPLFASIKEKNGGSNETYYLMRNDQKPIRMDHIHLDNIIIKMKENEIAISDNDDPPFVSIAHNEPSLIRREVMFVYKGDMHFEKVKLFMNIHPSILIHLTDPDNAKAIISSGKMQSSKDGFYGSGGYFSECEAHGKMKVLKSGAIIVCVVNLGKMFKAENKILPMTVDELKSQNYDSICGNFHTGPEYCVFDMSHVTPLFASITETNLSGVKEKYFLISTDNGTIRLETMPLNKLAIQIKENQITLSENDKQPFATLTHNNHIKEKELIFVHKGDFLFQKVEDIE